MLVVTGANDDCVHGRLEPLRRCDLHKRILHSGGVASRDEDMDIWQLGQLACGLEAKTLVAARYQDSSGRHQSSRSCDILDDEGSELIYRL